MLNLMSNFMAFKEMYQISGAFYHADIILSKTIMKTSILTTKQVYSIRLLNDVLRVNNFV
jgi:hypothetical protein